MNSSVFISGKKVQLRALTEEDIFGKNLHWLNDYEVNQFNSHGRFPYTEYKMKQYHESRKNTQDLVLAIDTLPEYQYIGNICLQDIRWVERSAEFAILMGEPSTWGKGYAKEAAHLLVRHGFEQLNLHRIHCGTFSTNLGMIGLAESLGMKKEGVRKDAGYKNGSYVDVIEFGILQDDFLSAQNR